MSQQELQVFDERTNENVVIALSEAQLIRAHQDSTFLEDLVDKYYQDQARVIQETDTQSEDQARAIQDSEQSSQNINELDCVQDDSTEENAAKALYIWSDACIFLLLATFEDNKENFQRQRHKKVYDNIAKKMREVKTEYIMTGSQCQSKINSLKKTYKKIKDHNAKSGNDNANWPYFNRMDELFGITGWANPVAVASEAGPGPSNSSKAGPAPSSSGTAIVQPKKRRLESLLENFIEEKKKVRTERARERKQHFDELVEIKKKQHEEKMEVLKSILNKINR